MRKHIIFLAALLCIGMQALAQEVETIEVTGKVVDANKEPLVGVNVTVENVPGLGAITDMNGLYKITTEPYVRLIFSYVGFQTQRILVKEQTIVNVTMKESEESVLDEIVVTGTGAQRKISVTGAITSVDVDDLNHNSSSSLANALAGNVAGVFAQQTSGQPGSNESEFWIRGISTFGASNAALVLVDGFERSLNEINVEDIESFQVLKDASETAIYGSRGANGVILITTRRGKTGKISIRAKLETTYNTRTFTPEYVDGYTYATLLNEARVTRNESPMYTDDELFNLQHGLDPDLLPNVDWKDVVLKDGAMSYRASLSLNGGGTNARYYVSASYVEEQGMYKNADVLKQDYNANANLRRWNYRMNTDIDITKTTLLRVGISGSLRFQNDAGKGSYVIWNSLTGYTPIASPIMFSNGRIPAVPDWVNDSRDNPWVAATQTGFRQNWQNKLQTNLTLEQDLGFVTKGLKFIGRFGFDTYNNNYINKRREPERWSAERYRDSDGNIVFHRMNEEQKLTQSSGGSGDRSEYLELVLNYSRGFKDHHVGATLKYNQESKLQTYNIGSDLKNSIPRRYQGWAGRVAYDWKYRYFINFNFGYTGSENFDKDNRYGFFPAVSGAWNVAEEPFVKKHFPWLNMFKIRYSWGKAGSSNTGDRFPYMYTIGDTTGYHWADYGSTNNYSGKTYTVMASPNIGWEVANKQDLGVDLSLFKDKFQVTVDYFHERRSGIMMKRENIPLTAGLFDVKTSKANVGKVLSTGFDGNFAYRQRIGKVHVTMRGNFTFSRNEIEEYDEAYTDYPYKRSYGYQVDQRRGYIALGLFKDWDDVRNSPTQNFGDRNVMPGDIKYKDVNGDGTINDDDKVPLDHTSRPGFIYGVGLSVNWKGLDVNVHFQGAERVSTMVSGGIAHAFSRGSWGNILKDLITDDRWISQEISGTPATENPNASYPRLEYSNVNGNNRQQSTYWLRDNSYLRLKTVEIGYTIPKHLTRKIHFNNIRIFFRGNNLMTFSKFKLWDPEMSNSDGTAYPISKSITGGLSVNI